MVDFTIRGLVQTVGQETVQKLANDVDQLRIKLNTQNQTLQARNVLFERELTNLRQIRTESQLRGRYSDAQIRALAQEQFLTEQANQAVERRIMIEREFLRLRAQGVQGTKAQIMALAEENVQMQLNAPLLEQRRRFLFQTAFALFAVSINIQFMLQSLIRLTAGDKEAQKSLQQLQGAFTLLIGPMQLTLGLMQLLTISSVAVRIAITGVIKTGAVLLPLLIGITTQSDMLRKVMLGIAAAFGIINALLLAYKLRLIGVGLANIFVTQTEIIKKAVQTLGLALPLIGGAIAGGLLLFEMLPKQAQTQVGFGRRIDMGRAHEGEVFIGRPAEPQPMAGGEMRVFIQIDSGQIQEALITRIERDNVSGVGV